MTSPTVFDDDDPTEVYSGEVEVLTAGGETVASWEPTGDGSLPGPVVDWVKDFDGRGIAADARAGTVNRVAGSVRAYRLLASSAPRGLVLLLKTGWRLVADDGYHADRVSTRDSGGDLLALKADHARTVRRRSATVALGLLLTVVAGFLGYRWWLVASWQHRSLATAALVVAVGVVVPVLGWHGAEDPRSILSRLLRAPVVTPPLTTGLIVGALQRLPGPTGTMVKREPRVMDRAWIQDPTRTPTGWECVFDLPAGSVETDLLGDKNHPIFAAGLKRGRDLVWPTVVPDDEGGHSGRCRLTVLRQPMRSTTLPAHPLADLSAPVSALAPAWVGVDHLGDPVRVPKINTPAMIVGAIPGHGKTQFLVNFALACCADPRSELWVFDGKADVDWVGIGEQIAHRYVATNPGDPGDAERALQVLEELDGELFRRRQAKQKYRADTGITSSKVTEPMMANRYGLHPLIVVIDETQTYFTDVPDKKVREAITSVVTKVAKQGRSFAMTVVLATQTISDRTIPTDISATAGARVAFKTGGHVQTQQILGSGATRAGYQPERLSNIVDAGIGYVVGGEGSGASFTRSFYLDDEAGEVDAIVARIRQLKLDAGRLTGDAAGEAYDPGPPVLPLPMIVLEHWPTGPDFLAWPEVLDLLRRHDAVRFSHWADVGPDSPHGRRPGDVLSRHFPEGTQGRGSGGTRGVSYLGLRGVMERQDTLTDPDDQQPDEWTGSDR